MWLSNTCIEVALSLDSTKVTKVDRNHRNIKTMGCHSRGYNTFETTRMSIENIFNELLKTCAHPSCIVDISILDQVNVLSPQKVEFNYSDAHQNLSGINAVIIKNFAANFSSLGKFPRTAVKAMETILCKDSQNEEDIARKMFLLHVTKADADPNIVAEFIVKAAKMTVVREIDGCFSNIRISAMKVFENSQLNETIDSAVQKYGVTLKTVDTTTYDVVFVSHAKLSLRGFSGVQSTYINLKHFETTRNSFADVIDSNKLRLLMEVDVINCVIHEYAHIKLREYCNDFNTSTPVARASNLPQDHFEFGRYIERKLFGKAIDWVSSEEYISCEYLESVIDAVKTNKNIPILEKDNLSIIVEREAICTMAFDCVTNRYFC